MKKYIASTLFLGLITFGVLLHQSSCSGPKVNPAPNIEVNNPQNELIERGEYLANHVAVCLDCHSTRDWAKFSGPIVDSTLGQGGEKFGKEMGFPGNYYAPNITPFHIGDWTDGEVYRAITTGVDRDGNPLFPVMPYRNYGKMDSMDVVAIIAYIRTLKPIKNDVLESKSSFPMNMIINKIPTNPKHKSIPSRSDSIAYGGYIVNAAGCNDCHTKMKMGKPIKGMSFAGGFEFKGVNGIIRSSNITPDTLTGIGAWTEDQFLNRFKNYDLKKYIPTEMGENDINSPMPWTMYAGMKDSDIRAVYQYLRSIAPVKNVVEKYSLKK